MNYPIAYPFLRFRRKVNKTEAQTPLIVEDVMPLTDSANDLNTRVEALENAPAAGSRIIASLENVNLKTIAANPLTWASGKTAANTAPTHAVVTMAAADTYVDDTTAFELQLNSNQIFNAAVIGIQGKVQTMNDTKTLVFALDGSTDSLYSNTGDWALPVTQGTLNDFRVNIYILGDTI